MDELDLLLKESLKISRKVKKSERSNRANSIDSILHTIYTNPLNWKAGRILSLIHLGSDDIESPLGTFREYFHLKTNARKLERCLDLPSDSIEYVRGTHWLQGPLIEPPAVEGGDEEVRAYLSRRKTAEVKEALKRLSADDLLRELDDM